MKKISIIVPAYNEAETIVSLLQAVRAATEALSIAMFEVIVIDDGSKDTTRSLLLAAPELYDHLIELDHQHGQGVAVLKGLQRASAFAAA